MRVLNIAAGLHVDAAGSKREDMRHMPFLDNREPFPFEEILLPFVLLARQRCAVQWSDASDLLSEEAHAGLLRGLLRP